MDNYKFLLEKAIQLHGEFCPGIVIGTKMCMAAMEKLGMNPMERNENLIVYVEIDRCISDAIIAITGCSLGNRKLKYNDYGKFVVTFTDIKSSETIRVSARDDKINSVYGFWALLENVFTPDKYIDPSIQREELATVAGIISQMSEEELLSFEDVHLEIPENDIPGFPDHIAVCSICGEHVIDGKEFVLNGNIICRSCANENVKLVVNRFYGDFSSFDMES
jgi:formylmethanofuran dehydrogenase subunit E